MNYLSIKTQLHQINEPYNIVKLLMVPSSVNEEKFSSTDITDANIIYVNRVLFTSVTHVVLSHARKNKHYY